VLDLHVLDRHVINLEAPSVVMVLIAIRVELAHVGGAHEPSEFVT
jgi:hypothetical protein